MGETPMLRNNRMRTFLIDTDTASDDAVALIMALKHPNVRVAAITVVAGNVSLLQATRNALYTAELCGKCDVPVHMGAAQPLMRETSHAEWFHGRDGLGDQNYPPPKAHASSSAQLRKKASLKAASTAVVEAAGGLDLKGATIKHNGGGRPIAMVGSAVGNGQVLNGSSTVLGN